VVGVKLDVPDRMMQNETGRWQPSSRWRRISKHVTDTTTT
jgi:hypothetical protein